MKINKAIRNIMRTREMSLGAMGKVLKKVDKKTGELVDRTGNDISARLNNDNLSFDVAVEMLDVLGYEIVVQKRVQGDRRDGQIVIDQRDERLKLDLDKLLKDETPTIDDKPILKNGMIKLV